LRKGFVELNALHMAKNFLVIYFVPRGEQPGRKLPKGNKRKDDVWESQGVNSSHSEVAALTLSLD